MLWEKVKNAGRRGFIGGSGGGGEEIVTYCTLRLLQ